MEVRPRKVVFYEDENGNVPSELWLESLSSERAAAIIEGRIGRLRKGLFGDCESVGLGVMELKIHFGPGFRIYFGCWGDDIVVILMGGTKGSQARDIWQARLYWVDYKKRRQSEDMKNG